MEKVLGLELQTMTGEGISEEGIGECDETGAPGQHMQSTRATAGAESLTPSDVLDNVDNLEGRGPKPPTQEPEPGHP